LRFIHEVAEILVFLSTEDDALYLWSRGWDINLFPNARLIRAGRTIDECEAGIAAGLHLLNPEHGGWVAFDGTQHGFRGGYNTMPEEHIYGWEMNSEEAFVV
jgi:hypothetical protein